MTTPHPFAEILRAIADGKQIQYQYCGSEWKDCDPELALSQVGPDYHSKPCYTLRIAPETIAINIAVPKPVSRGESHGDGAWVTIAAYSTSKTFHFLNHADARTVFDALCLPFKREGV